MRAFGARGSVALAAEPGGRLAGTAVAASAQAGGAAVGAEV